MVSKFLYFLTGANFGLMLGAWAMGNDVVLTGTGFGFLVGAGWCANDMWRNHG